MKSHIVSELDECIELSRTHREPVQLLGSTRGIDLFLTAFLMLAIKFGPCDYPCEELGESRYRDELGAPSGALAVWDFDYYMLSLKYDSESGQGVTLQWHGS